MINAVGRLINAARVKVRIVVHRDHIHTAAVLLRDALRHALKVRCLLRRQKPRSIGDIRKLRLIRREHERCRAEQQDKRQGQTDQFTFHFATPFHSRRTTAEPITLSAPAMAKNVPQNLPRSTGRSPAIFPVCPFMANRKSFPFHFVLSSHTGSSA